MPGHIFLSYAHDDRSHADHIEGLVRGQNLGFWVDVDQIRGGQPFWPRIEAAIRQASCLILLITPNSLHKTDTIGREVEFALSNGIPVIPLLRHIPVQGLGDWWTPRIAHLHIIRFNNFTQNIRDALLRSLEAVHTPKCKVVAVFNMKGGVGKTTLAAQLGARLNANHGKRVLFVDLDPQQNLTEMCLDPRKLEDIHSRNLTVNGLFEPANIGRKSDRNDDFAVNPSRVENPQATSITHKLHEGFEKVPSLDIIAGDHRSIKFVHTGQFATDLEHNFRDGISRVKDRYDFIIFDCNPSISFFTKSLLSITNFLLIPIKPDHFARRGIAFIENVVERFYSLDERPQFNAVFNGVSRQPSEFESSLMAGLRSGNDEFYKGTAWLSRGFLEAEIPESHQLRLGSSAIPYHSNIPFATNLMNRARLDPLRSKLNEMVKQYLDKVEGNGTIARQNIRAAE